MYSVHTCLFMYACVGPAKKFLIYMPSYTHTLSYEHMAKIKETTLFLLFYISLNKQQYFHHLFTTDLRVYVHMYV